MIRRSFCFALSSYAACAVSPALAQAWPSKPLSVVVGYAPGGGVDFVMRAISQGLGAQLGQPVIVDNKAGASGVIAATAVAKSAGDGYTLFGTDGGAVVLNKVLFDKLPYDPDKDLVPVSLVIRAPLILVAHPSFPASDLKSLIALARSQRLSYASAGKGTFHHLGMELLKRRAGFEAIDIPYKGAGPAAQDVIAGQVPLMTVDSIVGLPHLRAGKLKALAVLTSSRIPALPQVPTAAEQGVQGAEVYAWVGIVAPKGTPEAVVTRLSAAIQAVVQSPEVSQRFTELGMEPYANAPSEFAKFIDAESKRWRPLVQQLGLKLD